MEYEFRKVKIGQEVGAGVLTPCCIFCLTTNFDTLVLHIVEESARYAHYGRAFTVDTEDMRTFPDTNLIMDYHILQSLKYYCCKEPDRTLPSITKIVKSWQTVCIKE